VSLRVLVVDDNGPACLLIQTVLRLQGHAVVTAGDGAAGLRAAEADAPDVVFIDINLPDTTGYEVARRIRERLPDRPVRLVAMSGYSGEDDRREAAEQGFDDFLPKPFRVDALRDLMHELTVRGRD
jgi:CheY-like chemotaxis protein